MRRQGRVLAALSADTIQLTQSGSIKIGKEDPRAHPIGKGKEDARVDFFTAGIENSCEITAAEMDAATLKLLSLAEIVERLMKKNPPPFRWSAEAESLPSQLRSLPLEELLQSDLLRQSRDEGELVMIVGVANKTAYHRVDSFSDRS